MSQYETTQESRSNAPFEMAYSRKRSRSNSYAAPSRPLKRKFTSGRGSAINKSANMALPGARVTIPLTLQYDFDLTADVALSFAFDTTGYYVNGGTVQTIAGLSELATVFEMARIAKVEVSILPAATGLDYSAQTLSSGATNIPWVYTAVDYNDTATPTRDEMTSNQTCRTDIFNKVIKRTFFPRLEGSNGLIDVGRNAQNEFMKLGNSSTQKWNGFKVFMDEKVQVWSYGSGRCTMKVFFECMQSK